MQGDLLPLVVEHADQMRVPANPHAAADVLRRRGVVRLVDLQMAVAIDGAPGLAEQGEAIRRQRRERRSFDRLELLANLPLGRAVNPRIGDRLLPP